MPVQNEMVSKNVRTDLLEDKDQTLSQNMEISAPTEQSNLDQLKHMNNVQIAEYAKKLQKVYREQNVTEGEEQEVDNG